MLSAGERPLSDPLERNLSSLACVYLCDRGSLSPSMNEPSADRRIGHGEVAVHRIVESLNKLGFQGPAIVRVDGHNEHGLLTAQEAWQVFEASVP